MRRLSAGIYETLDGRYRIERGWAGTDGLDRRRQSWVVMHFANPDKAEVDILYDARTLTDARDYLETMVGVS